DRIRSFVLSKARGDRLRGERRSLGAAPAGRPGHRSRRRGLAYPGRASGIPGRPPLRTALHLASTRIGRLSGGVSLSGTPTTELRLCQTHVKVSEKESRRSNES